MLRAGAYELAFRRDVPARIVTSEYVDVASAFVDRDETGMVNAVLDQLARQLRADELAGRPSRRQRADDRSKATMRAFRTSGEFKIQAAGDGDHEVKYNYVLLHLRKLLSSRANGSAAGLRKFDEEFHATLSTVR